MLSILLPQWDSDMMVIICFSTPNNCSSSANLQLLATPTPRHSRPATPSIFSNHQHLANLDNNDPRHSATPNIQWPSTPGDPRHPYALEISLVLTYFVKYCVFMIMFSMKKLILFLLNQTKTYWQFLIQFCCGYGCACTSCWSWMQFLLILNVFIVSDLVVLLLFGRGEGGGVVAVEV